MEMKCRWLVMSRSWTSKSLLRLQWSVAVCFGLCVLIASAAVSTKTPIKTKIKTVTQAQNLTQQSEKHITTNDNIGSDQLRAYRLREVGVFIVLEGKIDV